MTSHAPNHAHVLAARCEDASICVVEIDAKGVAVVHGLKPGRTTVQLAYDDRDMPARDRGPAPRTAEGRVPVAFEPLPPPPPPPQLPRQRENVCPPLAPGAAAPWPAPASG